MNVVMIEDDKGVWKSGGGFIDLIGMDATKFCGGFCLCPQSSPDQESPGK